MKRTYNYPVKLTVEGIKCFKEKQTLDLCDVDGRLSQWTIIVGENGTGKTTLLQSLVMTQPIPSNSAKANGYTHAVRVVDAGFVFSGYAQWSNNVYNHRMLPDVATIELSIGVGQCGETVNERRVKRLTSHYKMGSYGGIYSGSLEGPDLLSFALYAYGSHRNFRGQMLEEGAKRERVESLFSQENTLQNPVEWLLRADYLAKTTNAQKDRDNLDKIKGVLMRLLPEVSDITFELIDNSVQVRFTTPFGKVSIDQLSDGYQSVLTWLVDFCAGQLRRHPDSPDIFEEPAVVLIDEYDLHMHPKWQRSSMQFLSKTFPNVQFIVTSHSPLVIQAAERPNVALLQRQGDGVVIRNDLDAIAHWRADQLLTSELFGLDTARPPHLEALVKERRELLSRMKLDDEERARLKELDERLEQAMPVNESPEEIKLVEMAAKIVAMNRGEGASS